MRVLDIRTGAVVAVRLLFAAAAVVVVVGCAGVVLPAAPVTSAPSPTTSAAPVVPASKAAARVSPSPRVTGTTSAVTLATFAGSWSGHTRSMTVSASGSAHDMVYDGCCTPEIDMTLRLSDPRGTSAARATATARVTAVALYALPGPAPKVGQSDTVSLVDGVLAVPFGGTTYCDRAAAARSECGA